MAIIARLVRTITSQPAVIPGIRQQGFVRTYGICIVRTLLGGSSATRLFGLHYALTVKLCTWRTALARLAVPPRTCFA